MSKEYEVKIQEIESVTRDVGCFVTTKPEGYQFKPGQAANLAFPDDCDDRHPFTFTSLPHDPLLEFTVKIYPERRGFTDEIAETEVGSTLLLGEPWGAITYHGPGTFIAGGAGITPYIAIFRDLEMKKKLDGHRLLFSNQTEDDVILAGELKRMLGDRALYTITGTESATYETGRIDKAFLEEHIDDFDQYFYVCGPSGMVGDGSSALKELGAAEGKIIQEDL